MQTRTLTLVIQHVSEEAQSFWSAVAAALDEYVRDLRAGHAGNGVFERHANAGCRIEAVASVPPARGSEFVDDVVAVDAVGALRARLVDVEELATYLAGGENDTEIGHALGYTPAQAAEAVRARVAEALAAIPQEQQ